MYSPLATPTPTRITLGPSSLRSDAGSGSWRSSTAPLRELDVLYDRTPEGELLHFYTVPIGGRVFFEVLERRGGYRSYGALNSPVRMAAQTRGERHAEGAGA